MDINEEEGWFLVEARGYETTKAKTFKEAEERAKRIVVSGTAVEIVQDDIVIARAHPHKDCWVWEVHPKEGEVMTRYVLDIGRAPRGSVFSTEDKVKALAAIKKGKPAKEALGPLYQAAEKELPKNASIVVSQWKKAITERLNSGDEELLSICTQYELVKEVSEDEFEEMEEKQEKRAAALAKAREAGGKRPGRPKKK